MSKTAFKLSPDTPPSHAPVLMSGKPYPDCKDPEVLGEYAGGLIVRAYRVDFVLRSGELVAEARECTLKIGSDLGCGACDYSAWNRDWHCATGCGYRATPGEALRLAREEAAEEVERHRARAYAVGQAMDRLGNGKGAK